MFADVFGPAAAEPNEQQRRVLALLLERALRGSLFDRMTHLRIFRQAEAHVAACDYDEQRAICCHGPGGDLFFVLRTHRMLFFRSGRRRAALPTAEEARVARAAARVAGADGARVFEPLLAPTLQAMCI